MAGGITKYLLSQYNVLRFYSSLEDRQWNKTENKYIPIVYFSLNEVPAIQVMVDDATTGSIYVTDEEGNELGDPLSMTISAGDGYTRARYEGGTLIGEDAQECGYYALTLKFGTKKYYSDVFGWTDDSDDLGKLIKINATSANFYMGYNNDYIYIMTDMEYECYLNVFEYKGIEPSVEEEANEYSGIITPYYSSLSKERKWIIDGNEPIYIFLLGLRVLSLNGSITVKWNGISYDANDIIVEIDDNSGNFDLVDILFSIKASGEVMTSRNHITE